MSEAVTTSAPSAPSTGASGGSTPSTTPTSTPASGAAPNSFGQSTPGAAGKSQDPNAFKESGGEVAAQSAPAAPRKLGATDMDALVEVKIDGQVQEMTLKEAIKLNQLERVSRQKMSEAQKVHADNQRLMQLAKTDPVRYMKDVLKIDPEAWAEEQLARKYDLQNMSPEAREALELKQQVEQFKTQDRKSKEPLLNELKQYMTEIPQGAEDAPREEIERFVQHKRAEFQAGQSALHQEIIGAWEAQGLPKEKDFGVWMAQEMIAHKKRTGENLAANDAAVKVKARFVKSTKSIFGQMDAQAIQDMLGKEIIDKLRAHDVDRVSKPQTPPWVSQQAQTATQQESKPMNEIEYRKYLRGLQGL